jgi:SAM-dependent methyltransferase
MGPRSTRLLFATTTFLAAALVFLVQPMVARQLLPTFGGAPGVWNATVTFFQLALLAGYAFAHVSLRLLGVRRQGLAQVALAAVALAFLPFALATGSEPPDSVDPAVWIAVLLAVAVGVPYLAVASASPTLQRWYASIDAPDSAQPWFLYAASNAGSLLGLLAYPLLLEPLLGTQAQERTWAILFATWLALLGWCVVLVRRRATATPSTGPHASAARARTRPSRLRRLKWVAVAALPVALMLGVTTYVTTDVASAPLLWSVPLALYLVSFMVTFGRRWRASVRGAGWAFGAAMLLLVFVEVERVRASDLQQFLVHVLAVFAASVLAHAVLYADRPRDTEHLTGYYLLVATGGAIGGMAMSLLAPVLLDDVYEYPLLLALALLLRPAPRRAAQHGGTRAALQVAELALAATLLVVLGASAIDGATFTDRLQGGAWLVVLGAAGVVLLARRTGVFLLVAGTLVLVAFADQGAALHRDRSFFGSLRVEDRGGMRRLLHGTTLHGAQQLDPSRSRMPTTYYTTPGPLGDAVERLQRDEPFVEVGVVGLGTGALVSHARLWQRFTFYEIDPDVIEVATDPELFTFLPEADVRVDVVEGDARLRLDADEDARFDLLVLDAYSSDAVPVHLLTVEALELYRRRLAAGGVLLLHVSSRHLDLLPVVAAGARASGLDGVVRSYSPPLQERRRDGATPSTWIALAPDRAALAPLSRDGGWRPLPSVDTRAWTDDYANVVGAIRWWPRWARIDRRTDAAGATPGDDRSKVR